MTRTDVLVVGGGPGGSTTAWACVRQGFDVTLIDRADFPRDKVCAGWITPAVIESLQLDLADYARGRVLQPIHAFRLGLLGGGEVTTPRSMEPVSYGIRRLEFDDYLLRRSGAHLRLGEPLNELCRDGDGWRVNGDLRARVIVGAGGHFCPVARRLGARVGQTETAILAQEVEFEAEPPDGTGGQVAGEIPLLLFCPDLLGYGWVFRKGRFLNVGLGREDPRGLAAHVTAFRDLLVDQGRLPAATPARFRGHAYRLYSRPPRRIVGDGMVLVGDAAGLAYPRSGEGIRPAVESGLLAARVLAEAGGDYRGARLLRYDDLLLQRFGERMPKSSGMILEGTRRSLAHRLLRNEWFACRVVQDRWFLRRNQSALVA